MYLKFVSLLLTPLIGATLKMSKCSRRLDGFCRCVPFGVLGPAHGLVVGPLRAVVRPLVVGEQRRGDGPVRLAVWAPEHFAIDWT